MNTQIKRRQLLRALLTAPAVAGLGLNAAHGREKTTSITGCSKLRMSLNAYSFNAPLSNGEMSLEEMMEFCSNR